MQLTNLAPDIERQIAMTFDEMVKHAMREKSVLYQIRRDSWEYGIWVSFEDESKFTLVEFGERTNYEPSEEDRAATD